MQFVDLLAVSLCLSLGSRPILAAFPAECGRARPSGQAVVINGEDANALEFPWHAGLYSKVSQEWTQICGGSLIHKSLVLTAAHCLYEQAKYDRIINAENLKVSFGSPFRDWSRITPYVQRRNVSRTFPHPYYRGLKRIHADDIALVELDQPITFTENVHPICVDQDGLPLKDGSKGEVVGWGYRALSADTPSPVLQSAEMPFIPLDRCLDAVHPDFAQFLSIEKFCAGQIGGAAVAPGDSGGGLAFPVNGRWWLSGIVSVGPRDRLSYSAFTRVASHKDWLDRVVSMVEETQELSSLTGSACAAVSNSQGVCRLMKECPHALDQLREGRNPRYCRSSGPVPIVCCESHPTPTNTPEPLPGSRIIAQKCREFSNHVLSRCGIQQRPRTAGWTGAGEFPHMALLGSGNGSDIKWFCGGALISPTFVLTTAVCVKWPGHVVPGWVRLGNIYHEAEESWPHQQIAVDDVTAHPMFKPPVQYHNIALLRLKWAARLNKFVHPACLHTERSVRESYVIVTGWGSKGVGNDSLDSLDVMKRIELDLASIEVCKFHFRAGLEKGENGENNPLYPEGLRDDLFVCASGDASGERDGGVCHSDAGGPMHVVARNFTDLDREPYCMHKIFALVVMGDNRCDLDLPSAYIRVYPYLDWIENIVWPKAFSFSSLTRPV